VESIEDRLREPGDGVTLIAASGLPVEHVGPLGEFIGSVSTNGDGRCEVGAPKLYYHELFRGRFPFPVRFEADVSVSTPNKATVAGLYAGEKRHPYPADGGFAHIAYLTAIAMGDADPNNPALPLNRRVGSGGAKFRLPAGGPAANALSQLVLVTSAWQQRPADPIDPHGRPGPWHQLAIEVDETGRYRGFWDGLPAGRPLDPATKSVETVLGGEMPFQSSAFGDGYGVFVRDGSAQFANVRVSRPKP
jgi:hypothetical protein